ncbi:MAG: hypothetical protein AAGC46_19450 [Solirubrobacteraceae bacterium]
MVASYLEMSQALRVHEQAIADQAGDLLGTVFDVAGIPAPTLGDHAVWLEVPDTSTKGAYAWDLDENDVVVHVAVGVPYDSQADDDTLAWKLADIVSTQFPDQMAGDAALRLTRVRGLWITFQRLSDAKSQVSLVVRARLVVPIRTYPQP